MNVLITGGAGFVGRHLVAASLARGWQVTATGRAAQPPAGFDTRARWCRAPALGPDANYEGLFAGVDAVVHLAALVHDLAGRAPADAYHRANVEGTRALAVQARAAGVSRFVLVSSVKAVAERSDAGPLTSQTPPAPEDPYGCSKLAAEQLLAALWPAQGLSILRPPLVYGPCVGGNFLRLLHAIDKGRPLPLAMVDNRRSLVAVTNLCHAIVTVLACQAEVPAKAWFVSDAEPLSTPALVRSIAAGLGRPPRLWPVPPGLLRSGAAMLGQAGAVARLTESLVVDWQEFGQAMDWQPPLGVKAAIDETCRWYRSRAEAGA